MKPIHDENWQAYCDLTTRDDWTGTRIKGVRDQTLTPGGRATMTLFEPATGDRRPHPRMRLAMPPAIDPAGAPPVLTAPDAPPADAAAFEQWLDGALAALADAIDEVNTDDAPPRSRRFYVHSVRTQRIAAVFAQATELLQGWLRDGPLPPADRDRCQLVIRRAEAQAYAGSIRFDDADTGTYHSFGHDAPFVHYLEAILDSLPDEGDDGFDLHDGFQQESIRRQRTQARNHLDHLMRHKYANHGITETDIERSLGGFLIDRETRHVVSETPDSASSLTPRYELLRVQPTGDHAHAGEYVYRDAKGGVRLQDGTAIEVDDAALRSIPVDAAQLSFRRAPDDPALRHDVRFDWDGNGYVQDAPIGWVSWAGHCDIKAIMEQLGVTLADYPDVREYRTDTGAETLYDRDLLVEMIASAMELGSVYRVADGSGRIQRGIHRFGGSRNDSRPDRIQFLGLAAGRSFRWPLGGRKDSFLVTGIEIDGEQLDPARVFYRYTADVDAMTIGDNPRFLKTIEGDYNLIDASGAVLTVELVEEEFDTATGYPKQETQTVTVDLRAEPEETRIYLGTAMKDAAARELYRVYLDRERNCIEAIAYRYDAERGERKFWPRKLSGETVEIPLARPLSATLSHEMRRDDPAMYQALLDVALRQAQNICADTDMKAEVWNGVVTKIEAAKLGEDRAQRTEHWRIEIKARFGNAALEYLLQRDERGEPIAYCPVSSEDDPDKAPDFLWQDFPDVASKGLEGGEWVINDTMLERDIVQARHLRVAQGRFYVYDDHVKNVFELIFCGLSEYRWTIVHRNKRYGFTDRQAWQQAIERVEELRGALRYDEA